MTTDEITKRCSIQRFESKIFELKKALSSVEDIESFGVERYENLNIIASTAALVIIENDELTEENKHLRVINKNLNDKISKLL